MNIHTLKSRFPTINTACVLFGQLSIFTSIPMVVHAQVHFEYSDEVEVIDEEIDEETGQMLGVPLQCFCGCTAKPGAVHLQMACTEARRDYEGKKCTVGKDEGRWICLARAGGDPE